MFFNKFRMDELERELVLEKRKNIDLELSMQVLKKERERERGPLQILLDNQILHPVLEYIYKEKPTKLMIIPFVEFTKDVVECFVGVNYGIKILDDDKVFLNVITLTDGDGMFVSEVASNRRNTNFLFVQNLAEYLKSSLDNENYRKPNKVGIEIVEEKNVGKYFFEAMSREERDAERKRAFDS